MVENLNITEIIVNDPEFPQKHLSRYTVFYEAVINGEYVCGTEGISYPIQESDLYNELERTLKLRFGYKNKGEGKLYDDLKSDVEKIEGIMSEINEEMRNLEEINRSLEIINESAMYPLTFPDSCGIVTKSRVVEMDKDLVVEILEKKMERIYKKVTEKLKAIEYFAKRD